MSIPTDMSGADEVGRATAATRGALAIVAAFSAGINVLYLTAPLFMMQVFDRVLASRSFDTLVFLTAIAIVAVALHAFLEFLRGRVLFRVSSFLDDALAPRAFQRAMTATLHGRGTGAECLRDLTTMRGFFGGTGIGAVFDAPWTPIFLLAAFAIHPQLGAFAAIGALLLLVIALANEAATRAPLSRGAIAQARAMRRVETTGRGIEAASAMGMLAHLAGAWWRESLAARDHHERAARRGGALVALARFLRLVLQIGILALGGWLVVQQEITAGAMVAASLILARALSPVEQALGAWRGFVAARAAHGRLRRFFAETPAPIETMALPPLKGHVEVERVSYAVPGTDRLVLKGVSMTLQPGQATAIIGPSGTGKSTLARMLVGLLRPTAGHVRLDCADAWLRAGGEFGRWIGFMPQANDLFAGSIARNIARMGEIDPEEVTRATRLAGVHEMILRLPAGYDTELDDGGACLSAGQRQRIALARALYGRPRLFVLDEPNSNLDFEGEEALVRAVRHLVVEGCTVVLITHRASLLECVDQIVALKDGTVWLSGERNTVLAKLRGAPEGARPAAAAAQRLRSVSPPPFVQTSAGGVP